MPNRIFIYEFITGGGMFADDQFEKPSGSLLAEGRAMLTSVVADLAADNRFEVSVLCDDRLEISLPADVSITPVTSKQAESSAFSAALRSNTAALIIAPEIGGHLLARTAEAEQHDVQLLSPSSEFVRLASDKLLLGRHLAKANVRTPSEVDGDLPCVVKPRDGCGSVDIQLVRNEANLRIADISLLAQRYVEGLACSVAMLCGADKPFAMPPMRQLIDEDNGFAFTGGRSITDSGLAERANRLASKAIASMPPARGYVGIDLVLGKGSDGSGDYVIEVNSRMTTSYIGLRHLCVQNLGVAMVDAAAGNNVELEFNDEPIEFDPTGRVQSLADTASR